MKAKYGIAAQLMADNYTFDMINEVVYIGNDVGLEIKLRITLTNRCYYGLNRQLSSTNNSQ